MVKHGKRGSPAGSETASKLVDCCCLESRVRCTAKKIKGFERFLLAVPIIRSTCGACKKCLLPVRKPLVCDYFRWSKMVKVNLKSDRRKGRKRPEGEHSTSCASNALSLGHAVARDGTRSEGKWPTLSLGAPPVRVMGTDTMTKRTYVLTLRSVVNGGRVEMKLAQRPNHPPGGGRRLRTG